MTRTLRIYNNPRLKKAQRFNIDDKKLHVDPGIPLTKRSWICMGYCPSCRDDNRDQRIIRKRNKEQFRYELKLEMCRELGRNGLGFEINPEYEPLIKKTIRISEPDVKPLAVTETI